MYEFRSTSVAALILLEFCFTSAAFGDDRRVEKQVDLSDERAIDAEIDFGLGDISIFAGESGKAVEMEGEFDDDRFDYDFDYRINGGTGRLYFAITADGGNWDHDRVDSEWRFGFTDRVPIDLSVDIGAASCEMRLGGLSVRRLMLDIGAADCNISFDKVNGCVLERMKVDAGASSVSLERLGNARFEILDFEGGVGSSDIDFSGKFDFDAEADITVGMGSVDIIVPEHIGVRVYAHDGFLSSIDIPKRYFEEVERDFFESRNWDDAEGHLEITLDVGMGSAEIDVR